MKPVVYLRESGNLHVVICPIPDWEGFDKLIKFMQMYYEIVLLKQNDGPGARRWVLEKDGHQFELIHDDGYGNYLLARTASSEPIVNEIAKDLEQRLDGVE